MQFNHVNCSGYCFSHVIQILNQRRQQDKFRLNRLQETDDKIIRELLDSGKLLYNFVISGQLWEYEDNFKETYVRGKNYQLRRNQAVGFIRFERESQQYQREIQILLQGYEDKASQLTGNIMELKDRIIEKMKLRTKPSEKQQFTNQKYDCFEEKDQKMMAQSPKKLKLIDQLTSQQLNFLKQSLEQPQEFKLIFRASDHEFRAHAFHEYCDNIKNTLTIVRTQYNKMIGGFTEYKWNTKGNGYVSDKIGNTCLLSFDLKQKLVPLSQDGLILCYNGFGPVFGIGYDLCLADQCNINRNSYANVPQKYNLQGSKKRKLTSSVSTLKNQKQIQSYWRQFSGARDGHDFRVNEYEVYEVAFQ